MTVRAGETRKPLRVWVDGQALQSGSRMRGIGRYVRELLRGLARQPDRVTLDISFNACMAQEAIAARALVADIIAPERIHTWYGSPAGGEAFEGYEARRQMAAIAHCLHVIGLAPDIALAASPFEGAGDNSVPLVPVLPLPCPVVSVFYDAIPHRFPKAYLANDKVAAYYNRRMETYRLFDANLAISDFSDAEFRDIIGPTPPSISISAGLGDDFRHLLDSAPSTSPPADAFQIAYVGAMDWRKNVSVMVDAIALLPPALRARTRLVMAGEEDNRMLGPLRDRWIRAGLRRAAFEVRGRVSDRDLVALYRQSHVLVQPALMEGFGLTALEAMACGTAVVVADRGALPEVVGDPALMFAPDDATALAHRLTRLGSDPDWRAETARKGQERAAQFTWDETARRTIEMFERLAAGPARAGADADMVASAARKIDIPRPAKVVMLAGSAVVPRQPRLLIDVTATSTQDMQTGIQRVVRQITDHLADMAGIPVLALRNAARSDGTWQAAPANQAWNLTAYEAVSFGPGDTILMLDTSWDLQQQHAPALIGARAAGVRIITCVYDLVPLRTPGLCIPDLPGVCAAWLKAALRWSDGFVCISQAVAQDLRTLLEETGFERPMPISWFHLGSDFTASSQTGRRQTEPRTESRTGPRNFLMVGTLEPRKGYHVALAAFEQLWAKGSKATLRIIGRPGWNIGGLTEQLAAHPERGQRLFWDAHVNDLELADAYAQADAVISTSYDEGFGLPLVEAAAHGLPLIVSDIPVYREVGALCGDCRYFRRGDSADLARIVTAMTLEKGHQATPPAVFSWSDSARQILARITAPTSDATQWPQTYVPASPEPFRDLFSEIVPPLRVLLPRRRRRVDLALLQPPHWQDEALHVSVTATNRSGVVLTSQVGPDKPGQTSHPVYLCCRLLDETGEELAVSPTRQSVPLTWGPDVTMVFTFHLSRFEIGGLCHAVQIGLMQTGGPDGPVWSQDLLNIMV